MLHPYVALIQVPQRGMVMMPIVAADPGQAIRVAGQLCVKDGQADATIVGLFDENDARNLLSLMDQAKASAAQADSGQGTAGGD